MNVELIDITDDPEKVICLASRNDYSADGIIGKSFEEVMEPVDGDNIEEKKRTLLTKLMKRGHWGPYEHVSISVAIENVSRVTMAQITRHRHASFDVTSGRYCEMDPDNTYKPDLISTADIGRGSDPSEMDNYDDDTIAKLREDAFDTAIESAFQWYQQLLDYGVPPEQARRVLPQSTCVNIVMSMSLRSVLHIADMRGQADAQAEVRELTEQILSIVEKECPIVMDYYYDELEGRKNRLSP